MCIDPVSMLVIGAAVGAGTSLISAGMQADAAKASAAIQAENQRTQAKLQFRQADSERQAGAYQARRLQDNAARLRSQQRTTLAANGVMIDEGTPLALQIDSATEADLDQAAIMYGADNRAANSRMQGKASLSNAKSAIEMGEIQARTAWIQGIGGAFGSITNGYANIGNATRLTGAGIGGI